MSFAITEIHVWSVTQKVFGERKLWTLTCLQGIRNLLTFGSGLKLQNSSGNIKNQPQELPPGQHSTDVRQRGAWPKDQNPSGGAECGQPYGELGNLAWQITPLQPSTLFQPPPAPRPAPLRTARTPEKRPAPQEGRGPPGRRPAAPGQRWGETPGEDDGERRNTPGAQAAAPGDARRRGFGVSRWPGG